MGGCLGWKPLITTDHDTLLLKNEAQINCCSTTVDADSSSESSLDSMKEALREAWRERTGHPGRKRGGDPAKVVIILPTAQGA
jgi:hypothetical protein